MCLLKRNNVSGFAPISIGNKSDTALPGIVVMDENESDSSGVGLCVVCRLSS
jgi:hypothetical protein